MSLGFLGKKHSNWHAMHPHARQMLPLPASYTFHMKVIYKGTR